MRAAAAMAACNLEPHQRIVERPELPDACEEIRQLANVIHLAQLRLYDIADEQEDARVTDAIHNACNENAAYWLERASDTLAGEYGL